MKSWKYLSRADYNNPGSWFRRIVFRRCCVSGDWNRADCEHFVFVSAGRLRIELPQAMRVQDSEQLLVHAQPAIVFIADTDAVPVTSAQFVWFDHVQRRESSSHQPDAVDQPIQRKHESQSAETGPQLVQRRKAFLGGEGHGRTGQNSALVRRPLVHETDRVSPLSQAAQGPVQAGPAVQGLQVQRAPQVQGLRSGRLHRRGAQGSVGLRRQLLRRPPNCRWSRWGERRGLQSANYSRTMSRMNENLGPDIRPDPQRRPKFRVEFNAHFGYRTRTCGTTTFRKRKAWRLSRSGRAAPPWATTSRWWGSSSRWNTRSDADPTSSRRAGWSTTPTRTPSVDATTGASTPSPSPSTRTKRAKISTRKFRSPRSWPLRRRKVSNFSLKYFKFNSIEESFRGFRWNFSINQADSGRMNVCALFRWRVLLRRS